VEERQLNAMSFDEAQAEYSENGEALSSDTLRATYKDQNHGKGVTKSQNIQATVACMEKGDVF